MRRHLRAKITSSACLVGPSLLRDASAPSAIRLTLLFCPRFRIDPKLTISYAFCPSKKGWHHHQNNIKVENSRNTDTHMCARHFEGRGRERSKCKARKNRMQRKMKVCKAKKINKIMHKILWKRRKLMWCKKPKYSPHQEAKASNHAHASPD
jgi:hypothetical protein